MLSQIPFELPLRFLPALASGEVVRYGAILKDAGTGRILGHLQESGVAQSLVSHALTSSASPLSLVASVINAGSGVYTAVQVRQLKAMIEILQSLQLATLGVSLAGVGVSVAGCRQYSDCIAVANQSLVDAVANSGAGHVGTLPSTTVSRALMVCCAASGSASTQG